MDADIITQPITAKEDATVVAPPRADALNGEPLSTQLIGATAARTTPVQSVIIALGITAFLFLARPVVLPIFMACIAAMTLKPLIRWLSYGHIPPALSAAVVLCFLVSALGIGFF